MASALMKEECCPSNEMHKLKTKFWNHAMVEAGHAAYIDRFHELARLVLYLVTPETKRIERYIYGLASQIRRMVAATEPPTIQSAILKVRVLTDEAVKNGSLKRNGEKRGESSKEGNVRSDNKKSRTGKVFATITNPVRKAYTETPIAARGACYEYGGTDHYKAACPRLNRSPGQGGNRQNQALDIEGGLGRGNNDNPVRGRAFVMGAKEARQDPNIVKDTFSLNNHYATMLFDSNADYSFVSTTFMPLLDIKPSSLVNMMKVIKGEFKKPESQKISDDSFTYNTSLKFFHEEFNRMSRMDDDLFTYEVEFSGLANIPCDLNEEDDSGQRMTHGSDDDMEGDDEVELTDEESSDSDNEDEVAEIFRIDTNVFDFETPMCKAFKKFNYLLQIDPDFLTKDIDGFKTYKEYKDDWIYEWNKDIPWDGCENAIYDHEERENEEEHRNEERWELFDNPCQEASVCKIRIFEMIKYSFGNDEENVTIKEHEYNDLTSTNEDACRTYQEIFRRMDEGWMVTRAE
ncbi:hypothetical protein Tco_0785806 [Tanacetum coccineum]